MRESKILLIKNFQTCTECANCYDFGNVDAISSEQSSCEICKPIYEQESEKYDKENFIHCYKCEFVVPLEKACDHW